MAGYIGIQPTPQATQTRDTFTATSNQTSFPTSGYTPEFLDVFMNGVHLLNGTDYTASNGSDVVLAVGATTGDIIEVVAYSTFTMTDQTFTGTTTMGATLRAPATFTIDPAVHGANSGTVVIAGDLTVNGTTTTINSTTISSADKNITLGAGGTASANNGAGITIDGASASLTYVHSGTKFLFNKDLHITGGVNPTNNLELNTNYRVRWNDSNDYSIMSDSANYIRTYVGGAQILSAESSGITVTGEIDASTLLKVGTNNTEYANNYIRFKPAGAAYIDHNTVGQDINFRTSVSSSLDTTPVIIKAGGNVGIGDPSPDQKLVVTNGNIKLKSNADGNTGILMLYDAAGVQSGQVYPSAGDLRIWSPNDVLILPTGSVGIGTTTPTQTQTGSVVPKLHVKAPGTNGAYDLVARFQAGNDISTTGASILINHENDRGLLIEAGRANGGDIGVAHFGVTNSGGVNTRALTILATGSTSNNVGIGTVTPGNVLEVKASGNDQGIRLKSTNNSDLIWLHQQSTSEGVLRIYGSGGAKVIIPGHNSPTYFNNGNNVGIGTPSPGSKLEVYNSATSGNTQLHIHNDKAGDAAVLRLEGKRTSLNDTGQVLFVNSGNIVAKIDARSAADDGALRFFTSASGTGNNIVEAMSIATNKAVAIGGPVTITSDTEYQFKINASSGAGASMAAISAGAYAYTVHQNSNKQWRSGAYGGSSYSIVNQTDGVYPLILSSSGAATIHSTVQATELICTSNGITFSGADGKTIIKTGRRRGTGTYTLFTNGASNTQSAGTVEIWGIYGTPSGGSYANYVISGNRSIQTVITHTQTNSVPVVSIAWNGAALQVSNSNGSLYYNVRVTLAEIGNSWSPTWGNFPGMS